MNFIVAAVSPADHKQINYWEVQQTEALKDISVYCRLSKDFSIDNKKCFKSLILE